MDLHGTYGINLGDYVPVFRNASFEYFLSLIGSGSLEGDGLPVPPISGLYYGHVLENASHVGDIIDQPANITIPLTIFLRQGQPTPFDYTLELKGSAVASSTSHDINSPTINPGAISAFFDVDFSHTLKWGGITSVTDANTGEPIDGWTITSASGFDYSQPAPEPSTVMLAALGGLALVALRWRHAGLRPSSPSALPKYPWDKLTCRAAGTWRWERLARGATSIRFLVCETLTDES
jgi:hypothetical protein